MKKQFRLRTPKKHKVRLPLSAYLSYLLLATLLLTGVSFSKYATTGSARDDAKVAVVMLDAVKDSDLGDIDIINGVTESSCEFYVTNLDSEVALEYTITITLPVELPTGLTMQLLDSGDNAYELASSGNTYTFTGGSFAARTEEKHTYYLTFTGNQDELLGDYEIGNINISVTAEQID